MWARRLSAGGGETPRCEHSNNLQGYEVDPSYRDDIRTYLGENNKNKQREKNTLAPSSTPQQSTEINPFRY
ncbi:hypothetical protein J4Q44_G00118240 [Coregonus suidteri]|uniref:Uncharacterized protein n=1 Tax=Coregonus suidteri TaxID=861788 RepID=A0AAN8LWB6_9TELE